ncbi:MAG: metal-dependent hydrolase [bacterium]|nr:metal-dependent hydrolase [bacterium]
MLDLDGVKIEWLGHACFKITGEKLIYIDPYQIEENEKADIILVTHGHYDHCSVGDIQKLTKHDTVIIATADCLSKLPAERVGAKDVKIAAPGKKFQTDGVLIEAVPAYNVDKQFHQKDEEWVGYIVETKNKRIYHAGDTDFISEMSNLKNIDVALLPIGGTYTMDAKEAAKAADAIKPKIAVPMHYGKIVGSSADAETFKASTSVNVELM